MADKESDGGGGRVGDSGRQSSYCNCIISLPSVGALSVLDSLINDFTFGLEICDPDMEVWQSNLLTGGSAVQGPH